MRRFVAALGLLALGAGRSGAQGTFLVGAAKVDVTPPPFDAAADAAMFPTCPAAVFTGPPTCWEATYSAPARRNQPGQFYDKND